MRPGALGILKPLTHIGALLPLAFLVWDAARGQLSAEPIREVQLRTGAYALTLLVLSLSCTPLSVVTGLPRLVELRRPLGLYAFGYAALHFLNFLGVDYGFDLALIREDIFEKRYAVAGLAAFLCLAPAAITSTKGWARRLGARRRRLHQFVYVAAALALLHFFWQTKADFGRPIIYGTLVTVLLAARLPPARNALERLRGRTPPRPPG